MKASHPSIPFDPQGLVALHCLSAYRWESVQEYFGDGSRDGVRAHYSVEHSPLGRGGAIRKGLALVPAQEEWVVALNGDTITAEELSAVANRYRERKALDPSHLATIMLVPMVSPYGLVDTNDQDQVVGFREKVEVPYWINAGIYIFDRRIEEELPQLGDHEDRTFPRLARGGRWRPSNPGLSGGAWTLSKTSRRQRST